MKKATEIAKFKLGVSVSLVGVEMNRTERELVNE